MDDNEMQRVIDALRALRPTLLGSAIRVHIDVLREPMRRVPQADQLVAGARRIGAALGLSIWEGHTGDVSEGNITQATGTPTLDGLGVVGGGPHTPDERILVRSLLERTALHAGMLVDLTSQNDPTAHNEER